MLAGLVETLLYLLMAAALLWAAAFDLRERRIPNGAVLALALGACMQMTLASCGLAVMTWLPAAGERLACCLAVITLGVLAELGWRASHGGAHGFGMGDIKLLAACALWAGFLVLPVLLLACVASLAVELPRRRSAFAFGPYIALAFGTCLLLGGQLQAMAL